MFCLKVAKNNIKMDKDLRMDKKRKKMKKLRSLTSRNQILELTLRELKTI